MKGLFSLILMFVIASSSMCARLRTSCSVFNVVDFGAEGSGHCDDSNAFLRAWQAACGTTQNSSTLVIPKGKTFMLQPVLFQGPCKSATINVQIQANLIPPENINDWKWPESSSKDTWIFFKGIQGLIVNGGGSIDGKGAAWWKSTSQYNRPTALRFLNCDKLSLSNLNHINSPKNHISINTCNGTLISNLNISAPDLSPNTDGIDISQSSNVSIQNSKIQTGDDCIAINTGSTFINITSIFCGPGHGISVGSLGKDHSYETVEQVIVRNCTFTRTQNGARIKTWAGGRGYARNITFKDIVLNAVKNPVIINQNYFLKKMDQSKSAVKVSNITYKNIRGTSDGKDAIVINCDSSGGGCTNIVLENINITCAASEDKPQASCNNAKGVCSSCNPAVPCLS